MLSIIIRASPSDLRAPSYFVFNVIFHSSPSHIYADLVVSVLQLDLREFLAPEQSIKHITYSGNRESILDTYNGYCSSILSSHILQLPSFFGTNNVGTTQRLMLSSKCSFRINPSPCSCKISFSFILIQQWGRFGRLALDTKSVWCFTPYIDNSPWGMMFRNSSLWLQLNGNLMWGGRWVPVNHQS
jgi:hypothetical protein